jgi:hypothetical protein
VGLGVALVGFLLLSRGALGCGGALAWGLLLSRGAVAALSLGGADGLSRGASGVALWLVLRPLWCSTGRGVVRRADGGGVVRVMCFGCLEWTCWWVLASLRLRNACV